MGKFLKARIIEGTDEWFEKRALENNEFDRVIWKNSDLAIRTPCNQEGFNALFNIGKALWEKDMCSKFEIAAFDSGKLFWKYRPDQWNFERNRYVSTFEKMIEEEHGSFISDDFQNDQLEMDYLKNYQDHFWRGQKCIVSVDCFEEILKETVLQADLEIARVWATQGDLRERLSLRELDGIGFEFKGFQIINPFFDETNRFEVEPISYYGEENMTGFIEQVKQKIEEGKTERASLADKIADAEKQNAESVKDKGEQREDIELEL